MTSREQTLTVGRPPLRAVPAMPRSSDAQRGEAPAVVVRGLAKAFGATVAVRDVSFTVGRGEVLGLLGPNGAGKTTTVRMLATLCPPDAGTATVDGLDVAAQAAAVRRVISLAGQYAAVDPQLTGRENLRLVGRLHHLRPERAAERADALLARFGLEAVGDRLARTYSGGMRRRLDLAASVVNRPSVLFLDEPTTGLDPASRVNMWTAVRELVADGTTVVLTTQYLEEADRLCDRLVVVDRGTVVATGTPAELKSAVGGDVVEIATDGPLTARRAAAVAERCTGARATVDPVAARVVLPVGGGSAAALAAVVRGLADAEVPVVEIGVRRPSLDEVFVALTGHHAGAGDDGATATADLPGGRHAGADDGTGAMAATVDVSGPAAELADRPLQAAPATGAGTGLTAAALSAAGLTGGWRADPLPATGSLHRARRTLIDWGEVARRNLLHVVRQPLNLIFLVVQPVMFVLLFRYVFGGALSLAVPDGHYVEFLLPGIVILSLAFGSMSTAVGLAEDLGTGMVDRLRSLPVARSAVLAGRLLADGAQFVAVMVIMLAVGMAVGFRFEEGPLAGLAMAALALAFGFVAAAWSGLLGIRTRNPEAAMTVGMTTVFPVCFVSGAFVPVATLPGWLQPVARANPVTVVVEAMRALAYGGPAGLRAGEAAAWLVGLAVVLLPLGLRAYRQVA